jgi:hypothetical protein
MELSDEEYAKFILLVVPMDNALKKWLETSLKESGARFRKHYGVRNTNDLKKAEQESVNKSQSGEDIDDSSDIERSSSRWPEFDTLEHIDLMDQDTKEFALSVSHVGSPILLSSRQTRHSKVGYKELVDIYQELEKEPRRLFFDGTDSIHPLMYTAPVPENIDLIVAQYEELANIYRYWCGLIHYGIRTDWQRTT